MDLRGKTQRVKSEINATHGPRFMLTESSLRLSARIRSPKDEDSPLVAPHFSDVWLRASPTLDCLALLGTGPSVRGQNPCSRWVWGLKLTITDYT
jgi:hypothetical protein